MKVEPFSPAIHLFKLTRSSSSYTYQNQDALTSLDSVKQAMGFESGSFTPTISDKVDCDVTVFRGIYSRVDNVVTMTLYLGISLDNVAGSGTFNVALPVASTFATPRDCYGTATLMTNAIDNMASYIISADTVNNKCSIVVEGNTGVSDVTDFIATIQYLVQ